MSINYAPGGSRASLEDAVNRVLPPIPEKGSIYCRYIQANGYQCHGRIADQDGAIMLCAHHLYEAATMVKGAMEWARPLSPEANREYAERRLRQAAALEAQSAVYYVRIGNVIKIGHSVNIKRRLASYHLEASDGELLATEPGGAELEKQRHAQFAEYRLRRREHFEPAPALMEHIAAVRELHGEPVVTTYVPLGGNEDT